MACARCHVEHRGAQAHLVTVDDTQCVACHGERRPPEGGQSPPRITSLADHPELALLRGRPDAAAKGQPPSRPAGFYFSHRDHVQEVRSGLAPAEQAGAAEAQLCAACHALGNGLGGAQRDFLALAAPSACFRCHAHDKHLKVRPAPAGELLAALVPGSPPTPLSCDALPRDFRCSDGQVEKAGVVHKDSWVLLNVRKLRRELYPEDHARAVARLRERALRLRRRLYLAPRLAGLSLDDLRRRRQALTENVRDLAARVDLREPASRDARAGVTRVEEAAAALSRAQDPAGAQLLELARSLGAPGASGDPDFVARRQELLDLLDALGALPGLDETGRRRVDVLRARVFALRPGEGSQAGLRRALVQRRRDLARVEDELALRTSGVMAIAEPDTGLPQAAAALQQVQARLAELAALEALPPVTDAAARARKEAALLALTGEDHKSGCAKCHQIDRGTFAEPVLAAEPVLTLARFAHARHLAATYPDSWSSRLRAAALPASETATPPAPGSVPRGSILPRCAYCHGDVERSESSALLHLQPIADCRACHRAGAQRTDCQLCHLYHPPSPRRP